MSDPTIQKLKTVGDHPIAPEALVVVFKAGPGVTRAVLPLAKTSLSRSITIVRGDQGTSPTIVTRILAAGEDEILVPGLGGEPEVELTQYGDSVVLQAIEPKVWLGRFSR